MLTTLGFFKTEPLVAVLENRFKQRINPAALFWALVWLTFIIQVALGITGSSFQIGSYITPFIASDGVKLWGQEQLVRYDEWRVLTPLAIAQTTVTPPFPVINPNLGEEGQNMLIVGMTGVPVHHISALAKPATWGFFLFDLRRALSWHWLFPIYGCLFTLWGVIAVISQLHWRMSFLLALSFCLSPFVAAWSNWPAYVIGLGCAAFLCLNALFHAQDKLRRYLYAILLGLAVAGYVLILYPPWQIAAGYVFGAMTVGFAIREKWHQKITSDRVLALLLSGIVMLGILYSWLQDAHVAITTMLQTAYPGQRSLITGGDYSLARLLRGFTNIVTLYRLDDSLSFINKSEIASFFFFLLPMAVLFLRRGLGRSLDAVSIAIACVFVFIAFFAFVGIPLQLAHISLLGRVPENRTDIGFALASLLLCATLLRKAPAQTRTTFVVAWCTGLIWAGIVFESILHYSTAIAQTFTAPEWILIGISTLLCGYYLAAARTERFIYALVILSFVTTFAFNPVSIAPSYVAIKDAPAKEDHILTIGNITPAMFLLAAGKSVVNGVFFYPQFHLWSALDPDGSHNSIYNRYNQLLFIPGETGGATYTIESPFPDVVKVGFDAARFDFNVTHGHYVVTPSDNDALLQHNPSLKKLYSGEGWTWYNVTKDAHEN